MEVDKETQAFLDLYVPRDVKVYSPPATEDVDGNIAARKYFQEVRQQESEMLAKLENAIFFG